VRRHVKASSAGSNSIQGISLGSRNSRLGLFSLAALALVALVLVATASASQEVFNYFGTVQGSGSHGGEFNQPGDTSVNSTGNGPADAGDIYVADELNNRIQRFTSSGKFVSAWGADVIQAGKPGDVAGTDPFEICTTAADCKAGTATGGNGAASGDGALNRPRSVAVDNDTGNVYVSDRNNRRVDEYDGEGHFIASFGFDVDATTAGTEYEVCPAVDACKAGVAGSGTGQYGSGTTENAFGIAVSPADGGAGTGAVFLADTGNRRVDTYSLDGTSPGSFGSAANFATEQPRKIAVDSRGIVYTSNTTAGGEIERYDSQNANGGGTVFLEPLQASYNEKQVITFNGFLDNDEYTLTCPNGEETDPILYHPYAQGPGEAESALNVKCGGGSVSISGQSPFTTFTVEFSGKFAAADVAAMTCTPTKGFGSCSVSTEVNGRTAVLFDAGAFPAGGTRGLAVHPDSDGAGPDTDRLYVLRNARPGDAVVQQFGPVNQPGLAAAPAASDDTHGGGAHFSFGNGLGLDDTSGHLLVSSTQAVTGVGSGDRVYILADPASIPPPILTLNQVTTKTDSTGIFSGTVDPKGGLVSCSLQYSTDQNNWVDAGGAQGSGVLSAGSVTIGTVTTETGAFKVGQTITSSDGGIPPGDTIIQVHTDKQTLVLNQPVITSGTVTLTAAPTPNSCASLAPNGGAQVVSVEAAGLVPKTHYFVRLQASRPLIPDTTTVAPVIRAFETDAPPPVVSEVGAIQVADTSMRLVGTIDPRHSPTGYAFEYGTTPALGSSTPPVDIGSGTTPITVSQVIGGLSPDTTYYFRLVATNLTGTTTSAGKSVHTRAMPFPPANPGNCANEEVRQQQSSTYLPDCRAYELVSPPGKNQGAIDLALAAFSRDGNGAAFCTSAIFGEPPGQQTFACAPYISRRGPGGWNTSSPFPRYCNVDPEAHNLFGRMELRLSSDFRRVALEVPESRSCPIPPLDPAAPLPSVNLYREDLTSDPPGYDLLAPAPSVLTPSIVHYAALAAYGNDDFSHIVYGAVGQQTPDPNSPPGIFKLYDWEEEGHGACATPGGCLSLISRKPNGEPFETASTFPGNPLLPNVVSSNGDRIYFQNEAEPNEGQTPHGQGCYRAACRLYMREDDAITYAVSASECNVDCGVNSSPAILLWAAPAGDKALFTSCAKLTDASASAATICTNGGVTTGEQMKLYRWDLNAPPGHRLVDLSVDREPTDGSQPQSVGVIGASDDGDTVFFVTGGQIVAGEPTDPGLKLYRWRWNGGSPSVDYLSPYKSNEETYLNEDNNNAPAGQTRVTADGKYLLISSNLALDPVADRDLDSDMYRWDEAHGWLCVSCQPPGVPSAGPVNSIGSGLFPTSGNVYVSDEPDHEISDDGQRVFFSTPDALVPEDMNGDNGCPKELSSGLFSCADVYEWHDGTVSLITSGTGSEPFVLSGVTHTGEDVFIATPQRLVGWDVDNSFDFYDVRVGGGFSEPPPQPPPCEGEACRSVGTRSATSEGAGTAVFAGQGNPKPKHHTSRKHHKKRHHKRQRANHDRRVGR